MKRVSEKPLPHGRRRVTVELDAGEVLVAMNPDRFYNLGEPCDGQIMLGDILVSARPVSWCSIEQRWLE